MLSNVLDTVFVVALIVAVVNRPKPWGRRIALGFAAIVLIVYASVPALRHQAVREFLKGVNEGVWWR